MHGPRIPPNHGLSRAQRRAQMKHAPYQRVAGRNRREGRQQPLQTLRKHHDNHAHYLEGGTDEIKGFFDKQVTDDDGENLQLKRERLQAAKVKEVKRKELEVRSLYWRRFGNAGNGAWLKKQRGRS